MPKVYDPILCMMVDKPATRTTDAKATDKAGEMWFLKVDGKTIKAFEKWGAPVAEAKKYMRENNIPGVGILKRLGRSGEYTITAKDSKTIDKAIKTIDANGEPLVNLKTGVTVGWIIDKGKRLVKNSYGNVYKVSVGDLAWLRSKQSKGIVPEDIKAVGERMIDLE